MRPAAVVGLGNPGERYAGTRHNVGFEVVKAFLKRHGVSHKKGTSLGLVNHTTWRERPLFFLRPRTYMNLSGDAVQWLLESRQIDPHNMIVVIDDFALPLGKLRLKSRGSSGGHNGLKDITAKLQTSDYPRLRLGIGPIPEDQDPADFVLEPFRFEEDEQVEEMVARACDCLQTWLDDGLEKAMSEFNRWPSSSPEQELPEGTNSPVGPDPTPSSS